MTAPAASPEIAGGVIATLIAAVLGWGTWITKRVLGHHHPQYITHEQLAEMREKRDRQWHQALESLRMEIKADFNLLRNEIRDDIRDVPRLVIERLDKPFDAPKHPPR